ncbi:hypothetical protein [Microbaculum marinum]|uniref:SGNH/GDSL hydrolase family protein n=1 Tax=Microbaculum marinum TaxID=1764581 RepID=A0AAW9RY79_9HYPH
MNPRLFVFGDSHTNPILQGFRALGPGISVRGGRLPLMGLYWPACFHTGADPLRFVGSDTQAEFQRYAASAGFDGGNVLDVGLPMVTSLSGMTPTANFFSWYEYHPVPGGARYFMSSQLLAVQLDHYYTHILDFYRRLAEAGKTVLFVVPPALRSNELHESELFHEVRHHITTAVGAVGVQIVDVTETTCDPSGMLRRQYWSDVDGDIFHANAEWGREVAGQCCRLLGLQV